MIAEGDPPRRNAREAAPAAQDENLPQPSPLSAAALKALAWETYRGLPGRYRDGLPGGLRFPMVAEVRGLLADGFGQAAILHYAALCTANDAYAGDKHLPLLRHAVRLLRQDVRLGLACPACGIERDATDRPPCDTCNPREPGVLEPDGPDPETLAKIRERLGVRPDELEQAEGA